MRAEEKSKYALKFDDLLLRLLNSYHNLDASEVLSFFGERALEMLECEPNITNKSRRPITTYVEGQVNKTITWVHRYSNSNSTFRANLSNVDTNGNKVYVLRGFYPDTHIPFKMTLVKFSDYSVAMGKVTIGLKEHHTKIYEENIAMYNDAVSEAILLGKEVDEEFKVKYDYRKFQCMRPKGMELYHERQKTRSNQ